VTATGFKFPKSIDKTGFQNFVESLALFVGIARVAAV